MNQVTFLTRDGCSNTATMRENLDEALRSLKLPAEYLVINLASLPETDARGGYPTPTVLYAGKDVFGMAEPAVPYPPPTWRIYPDGVPSAAKIQKQLNAAANAK